MMTVVQEKLDEYKHIYEQLKEKLRWKISDKRTLMIVASMYVVNDKPFHFPQFFELSQYVKKQAGFFSPLKSYSRFTIAAMLDVRFEQPIESFHKLLELYNRLAAGGFSRGIFTYIAAAAMLSNREEYGETLARSLAIYKGMKAKHKFLTSSSDYPLAVLLGKHEDSVEILLERMGDFYEKLSEVGFSKGNDLQFLSHILSLHREVEQDILIGRCAVLLQALKQSGQKVKKMHYSTIGLLALLEDGTGVIEEVGKAMEYLNKEKRFKAYRDVNFMMAVNFLVSDKISDSHALETGLYTAIEAIIQAQQAAMVSYVAVISASSSVSSGDGS